MSVVDEYVQTLSPNWMSVGEWMPSGIIGSLQGWGHLHISVCRDLGCALYMAWIVSNCSTG